MKIIIQGTPKEIAALLAEAKGRHRENLLISSEDDINTAAAAIHGIRLKAPGTFASKGFEPEGAAHHEDPGALGY